MARTRTSRAGTEAYALLDALAACAISASVLMAALALSSSTASAEARVSAMLDARLEAANALAESVYAGRGTSDAAR